MTRVRNSKKASGSNRSAVRSDSITSRAWQDAFSPLEPRTLLSDVQGPVGGPPSSMVASLTWHGSVVGGGLLGTSSHTRKAPRPPRRVVCLVFDVTME